MNSRTQRILLIAVSCLTAGILLAVVARPARLVTIRLEPRFLEGLTFISSEGVSRAGSDGAVHCEMYALCRDSIRGEPKLSIQPTAAPTWYEQPLPQQRDKLLILELQLGSSIFPVKHDEAYVYRLEEGGRLLSEGRITLEVEEMAATRWFVAFIGLAASVLQILALAVGWPT